MALPDLDTQERDSTEEKKASFFSLGKSIKNNNLGDRQKSPGLSNRAYRIIKEGGIVGAMRGLGSDRANVRSEQNLGAKFTETQTDKTAESVEKLKVPLEDIKDSMRKLNETAIGMKAAVLGNRAERKEKAEERRINAKIPNQPAEHHGKKDLYPPDKTYGTTSMAEYIQRSRGWKPLSDFQPTDAPPQEPKQKKRSFFNKKVASSDGESPSSAYRQNERTTAASGYAVTKFESEALEQLAKLFSKAFDNMPSGGLPTDQPGGLPPGFFTRKPGGAKKPKRVRGKPTGPPRDAKGRFIKAAANSADEVAGGAAKGGLLRGLGRGASKALPFLARGAGVAAVPVMAGLDAKHRMDEGQSKTQIIAGTGASTAGALAGGIAGAQGGALVGGGIGAMFAGVGAVPGAAIGGVVGGVGGAIAGSSAGGWLADKFTGVGKPKMVQKVDGPTAQSKDLIALEERKAAQKKKSMEATGSSGSGATMINAPTTTTVVQQRNQSMIQSGGSAQGYRGSLDLRKFVV